MAIAAFVLVLGLVCLGLAPLLQWTKEPAVFAEMIVKVDDFLLNPLQHAVAKNAPVALVQSMVSARPALVRSSFDSRRRSLLHLAAAANADTEVGGWVDGCDRMVGRSVGRCGFGGDDPSVPLCATTTTMANTDMGVRSIGVSQQCALLGGGGGGARFP